jgi:phosphatidylserine/phosphatidylglycerophosphate/cardiolipin synthase-like enzyme
MRLFRPAVLAAVLVPALLAGPTLVTEPGQGLAPIYALLAGARKSIDLTLYELADSTVMGLLERAAGQGVTVRVVLDQNCEGDRNQPAYQELSASGVAVAWAAPGFACTHQKTLTVDRAVSALMTFNFSPQYYATSRDFAVVTSDPADVAAIEDTFAADFAWTPVIPPTGDDLVWSPSNAQSSLLDLVGSAGTSLLVENEEMSDGPVVDALCAAAASGVSVRIVMTDRGSYQREFARLREAGAQLALYPPSAPLYIHAKVVLADGARAFIGSENFSQASLTRNRELGVILTDPAVLASVQATLAADFAGGQH